MGWFLFLDVTALVSSLDFIVMFSSKCPLSLVHGDVEKDSIICLIICRGKTIEQGRLRGLFIALNVKFNWGSFCKLMCLRWRMHNPLMVSLIFGYGGNDNKRILQIGVLIFFAADKSPKRINVCTVCSALLGFINNKMRYWEHSDPLTA